MEFAKPLVNPWSAAELNTHLEQHGPLGSFVPMTQAESGIIRSCYGWSGYRIFHGDGHGGDIGQPYLSEPLIAKLSGRESLAWYLNARARSGLPHDSGYPNVDGRFNPNKDPWAPTLRAIISEFAYCELGEENGKPVYRTFLTEAGKDDEVTRMVAHVFGLDLDNSMIHNQGGNELISALFAAKLYEPVESPKMLVAVTAAIEATRPFLPAMTLDEQGNVIDDGRMNDLVERLKTTRLTLNSVSYQPDTVDINDLGHLAVDMANRDVSSLFFLNNASMIVDGGRQLREEEKPLPEDPTMLDLQEHARPDQSAPSLYKQLLEDASNVTHVYIERDENGQIPQNPEAAMFPSRPVYDLTKRYAKRNTQVARNFFEAYLGPLVAVCVAICVKEPQALVRQIVDSATALPRRPQQYNRRPWNKETRTIHRISQGEGQQDVSENTPAKSPLTEVILAGGGLAGVKRLNRTANRLYDGQSEHDQAFSRAEAAMFLGEVLTVIGRDNFEIITEQMSLVAATKAPVEVRAQRIQKLRALPGVIANMLNEQAPR